MDELVADAESAGRRGGLVWFAVGGAEAVKPALLGDKGCETNGYNEFQNCILENAGCRRGKYVPYSRWTQDYIAIMGGR
jgi:hypothetical protein